MNMTSAGATSLLLSVLLIVALTAASTSAAEKKKLLLLGQSPDSHPPTTHEYMAGMRLLAKCLAAAPDVEVEVVNADEPWARGPELLDGVDGAVLFLSEGAKWLQSDPQRLAAFRRLAARGGGLVCIHWAMGTKKAPFIDNFTALFGGCHGGPDRKYQVLDHVSLRIAAPDHPIASGVGPLEVREEFYYQLKFVKSEPGVEPLVQANIDDKLETVGWTWQRPDGGRSFGFSGGHFHDNWRHVEYRRLIAQAALWVVDVTIPADGLNVDVTDEDLKLR